MPRFTTHCEAVYEAKSSVGRYHPFYGDALDYWEGEHQMGCGTCGQGQQGQPAAPAQPAIAFKSLDEWYAHARATPSDFNEHMDTLRDLASKSEVCVDLSFWRKPALLAMLAARPKEVISISPDAKTDIWEELRPLIQPPTTFKTIGNGSGNALDTEPFAHDLFFPDTQHDADWLYKELSRWAPHNTGRIAIHCSAIYGEKGDLGKAGVLAAVRQWVKEHKNWSAVSYYPNNYGLTVLSCRAEDKKTFPGKVKMALNFAKATIKHKLNGGTYLPLPLVQERMDVCSLCEQQNDQRCAVCGCALLLVPDDWPVNPGQPGKLWYPVEVCPIGKWEARPNDGVAMTSEEIHALMTNNSNEPSPP